MEVAANHGIDPDEFAVELASDRVSGKHAVSAQEAFERGAFGVSTFFVGERMFWGNDRLGLVRHALLSRTP